MTTPIQHNIFCLFDASNDRPRDHARTLKPRNADPLLSMFASWPGRKDPRSMQPNNTAKTTTTITTREAAAQQQQQRQKAHALPIQQKNIDLFSCCFRDLIRILRSIPSATRPGRNRSQCACAPATPSGRRWYIFPSLDPPTRTRYLQETAVLPPVVTGHIGRRWEESTKHTNVVYRRGRRRYCETHFHTVSGIFWAFERMCPPPFLHCLHIPHVLAL